MVTVRKERPAEAATRDALLDLAYGPARFAKTSERLREGRRPELALVAAAGRRDVGTVPLWQVSPGPDRPTPARAARYRRCGGPRRQPVPAPADALRAGAPTSW